MMPKPAIHIGLILLAILTPTCSLAAQEAATTAPAPSNAAPMPTALPRITITSQPVDDRPAWLIRELQRPDRLKQVAGAMTFSPEEVAALSDITDRTEALGNDRLLLLMLSHVAKIPPLGPKEFNSLEPASVRAMEEAPDVFRGAAVRMDVRVFDAEKLSPGHGMDYSLYWPKDAVLWKLRCTSPSAMPAHAARPLIILSTVDPVSVLGKPRDISPDGRILRFDEGGVATEMGGVFFKLCRAPADDGGERYYPVLLAWLFRPTPQAVQGSGDWMTPAMLLAMALVLAFFCWRYLRGRIARSKAHWQEQLQRVSAAAESGEDYSHERVDPALLQAAEAYFEEHPEARPRHRTRPGPESNAGAAGASDDEQVDPALKEAAEQFTKEHPEDDGKRPS